MKKKRITVEQFAELRAVLSGRLGHPDMVYCMGRDLEHSTANWMFTTKLGQCHVRHPRLEDAKGQHEVRVNFLNGMWAAKWCELVKPNGINVLRFDHTDFDSSVAKLSSVWRFLGHELSPQLESKISQVVKDLTAQLGADDPSVVTLRGLLIE